MINDIYCEKHKVVDRIEIRMSVNGDDLRRYTMLSTIIMMIKHLLNLCHYHIYLKHIFIMLPPANA